jgi:hypothetical protein
MVRARWPTRFTALAISFERFDLGAQRIAMAALPDKIGVPQNKSHKRRSKPD